MKNPAHQTTKHAPVIPGALFALTGALFWSTGGAGIKLLSGMPPLATNSGRSLVAGLLFLFILRARVVPIPRDRALVAAGAVCYMAVVISFVLSTRFTTAANAIILQYTSLFWIALLGWITVRECPRFRELLALLCGAVGVVLCMGDGVRLFQASGQLTLALTGDLLALASSLAFALTTLFLRRINKREAAADDSEVPAALQTIFWGNVLAAVTGLPFLLRCVTQSWSPGQPHWVGWLVLLWLGIGQLGLGYLCFQQGLKSLRALTASLLTLIEPVLNPVWVFLLVSEVPGMNTVYGGMFVLAAITVTLLASRGRQP